MIYYHLLFWIWCVYLNIFEIKFAFFFIFFSFPDYNTSISSLFNTFFYHGIHILLWTRSFHSSSLHVLNNRPLWCSWPAHVFFPWSYFLCLFHWQVALPGNSYHTYKNDLLLLLFLCVLKGVMLSFLSLFLFYFVPCS